MSGLESIHIRPEEDGDRAAIRRINESAFGGAEEANLIDALRSEASPFLSLVSTPDINTDPVGHILFTPVTVRGSEASTRALALAPLAVLPEYQSRGHGSALVRAGLKACKDAGYHIIFVVGHPSYYPRFGFKPARARGFECEFPVSDEAFMVNELEPGALEGVRGTVYYHEAFRNV